MATTDAIIYKETVLDYLKDTYKFESESTVLNFGKNDKGSFFILNETIFHPQGTLYRVYVKYFSHFNYFQAVVNLLTVE